MSPALRSAWRVIFPEPASRRVAFALDGTSVELVFVGGVCMYLDDDDAASLVKAALSRLAFDTRFADWLRGTLGQPALAVAPPPSGARWLLTVDTAHGPFRAAVDADNDG